jgi:hypothetical protein
MLMVSPISGDPNMAHQTPGLQEQHAKLAPLSSRYVNVESLPWQPTRFPGIEIKVLMEDPDTGLQTVLTRMAPGNFVWRPPGSRHVAHAPNGALVLGFFLKPNTFF